MTRRTSLPSSLVVAAFSSADARAAGVSRSRLRGRDLEHPHRGSHVAVGSLPLPDTPTPRDLVLRRMLLLKPVLAPDQFFSHISAAVFWGLPLPRRLLSGALHVSTLWPRRAPRISGVVGHALRKPRTVERAGLRVEIPTDAWCQLARVLTLDELVVAGDALFYRQRKLATREHLASAITRWGSTRGATNLRAAFELIRENAESPKETEWRLIFVRAGLPEPVVNYAVYDENGVLVAIIDLAFPQWKTGADYEGRHHAEDPEQFARDGERYNALLRLGWHDIRIMSGMSRHAILNDVRDQLWKRGWRP